MGDIIDIIVNNMGLLIPVVAALFAFLTNLGKNEEKEKKKAEQPQPVQTSSQSSPAPSQEQEKVKDLKTYAEEQRERYKSFKRDYKGKDSQVDKQGEQPYYSGNQEGHDAIPDQPTQPSYRREQRVPYRKDTINQPSIKVTGVQNLSKKKLAESVVMAEVLGKPRSRNPHRSPLKK